jgi:hypothetical protein
MAYSHGRILMIAVWAITNVAASAYAFCWFGPIVFGGWFLFLFHCDKAGSQDLPDSQLELLVAE